MTNNFNFRWNYSKCRIELTMMMHPHLLLQNPTGYISKMVSETISAVESQLRATTKNSYSVRQEVNKI